MLSREGTCDPGIPLLGTGTEELKHKLIGASQEHYLHQPRDGNNPHVSLVRKVERKLV
jgi:hypothetical protein